MAAEPAPSDQLAALLSGKRSSARRAVDLPVRIKGVRREFEARACDLSEGGVLLELAIDELVGVDRSAAGGPVGPAVGPAEQLDLIETHFRDSFDVQFDAHGVVLEANLVRMSVRPEAPDVLLLGCQFAHVLGDEHQGRLGLRDAAAGTTPWGEVAAIQAPEYVHDPAHPAWVLVYDDEGPLAGPRFLGPLRALGGDVLVARLDGADAQGVALALCGRGVRLRVLRGSHVVWESPASLLATRFLDGASRGAEVAFLPGRAPGRRVRRLLRRRAG